MLPYIREVNSNKVNNSCQANMEIIENGTINFTKCMMAPHYFQDSIKDPSRLDHELMEMEQHMYRIRQVGVTKSKAAAKLTASWLQAMEDLAKIEKKLIHARLEAEIAATEAEDDIADTETDKTFQINTGNAVRSEYSEKNAMVENETKFLEDLPVLKQKSSVIPFAAKVATSTRALCDLDCSYFEDTKLAEMVFHKFVDVFMNEWIEFVSRRNIEDVYLTVIVEFLNEEAIKVANDMPIEE